MNNTCIKTVVSLDSVSKKYPVPKNGNKDIKVYFDDFWALKDITFDVKQGEILGIIGRNGAGKTTLLNIVARVLSPTQGKVNIEGRTLGLFNLGVGFQDTLTGRENIFLNGTILGATNKELESKLNRVIDFSELGNFIDMPLGTYSQGMRLRLGFSIIANLDFDILAIDEILAVGDALFQNKCYERMMDFKRSGKTLILTTQNMDLIDRLCDNAILFDHGKMLFHGRQTEAINRYRSLLNTDKFFVGPAPQITNLIENTKKWADDRHNWGERMGTKDIVINSVCLINRFGLKCNRIKSRESLRVKSHFTVKNAVRDPHFGIAVFREDGVYCYGTNTKNDALEVHKLNCGNGWFELIYKNFFLAPGEYRISTAVWDKNETIAYDYHIGCYKLIVMPQESNIASLTNIPFKLESLNPSYGSANIREEIKIETLKCIDYLNEEKDIFTTNEFIKIAINFNGFSIKREKYFLQVGLYRDDDICCQSFCENLILTGKGIHLVMTHLKLLPGKYKILASLYDATGKNVVYRHKPHFFRVVFNKNDHGTVFLEHKWKLCLPR